MRESRLSGSEGGVAPMGHPYPYGRRDARRYERMFRAERHDEDPRAPGAPVRVRRGEHVKIMTTRVRT
jgi:hypothetical protein